MTRRSSLWVCLVAPPSALFLALLYFFFFCLPRSHTYARCAARDSQHLRGGAVFTRGGVCRDVRAIGDPRTDRPPLRSPPHRVVGRMLVGGGERRTVECKLIYRIYCETDSWGLASQRGVCPCCAAQIRQPSRRSHIWRSGCPDRGRPGRHPGLPRRARADQAILAGNDDGGGATPVPPPPRLGGGGEGATRRW